MQREAGARHIPPSPVAPSTLASPALPSMRGRSMLMPPPSPPPVPPSMAMRRHEPLWQLSPVQHSLLSRQPAFSERQAQRPLVQDM